MSKLRIFAPPSAEQRILHILECSAAPDRKERALEGIFAKLPTAQSHALYARLADPQPDDRVAMMFTSFLAAVIP